jgi:histidyl-tRNA synthetase
LSIATWRLELNSLGQPEERAGPPRRADRLFRAHAQLDEDAQRRLHSNPLRILDTKNPAMQALVEPRPR